ncbi:MAG: porin family protein [Beijerinckiaceae bacterium]|nr:porin family protein [Beijerinckiaceae bacterium]
MIRKLLATSIVLAAVSGTALAADLPSSRAPIAPPPLPVFSWAGGYAGAQIGYQWGKDNITNQATFGTGSASPSGVVGGLHTGYNWETSGFFVFGGEADIEGSSYSSSYTTPIVGTVKSPIQGSIRARAGFAVDRVLFFATGGAEFAWFKDTYPASGDTQKPSKVGYTVGGGVEYALTNNWSVRGEYRYINFSSKNDSLLNAGIPITHQDTENRVDVGFSYKFDWPVAPVVAKY